MKVLIVDDDEIVVESLSIILSADAEFEIVGHAFNGDEAVEFCEKGKAGNNRADNKDKADDKDRGDNKDRGGVDVVLMDIQMPVMDGISACRIIKKSNPDIKIIMLTTFHDYKNIHQSLQAGASGYLLKSDDVEIQKATIKNVYAGLSIISEDALKSFSETKKASLLTPRENDILELIANGLSNKEIAGQLFISEGTLRNTISVILEKLELRDRTQLAIYYWQMK